MSIFEMQNTSGHSNNSQHSLVQVLWVRFLIATIFWVAALGMLPMRGYAQPSEWMKILNVYNSDYTTVKSDSTGGLVLVGSFILNGNFDLDPGPGIQTAYNDSDTPHLVIAKYDANGNYLWSVNSEGSGSITKVVSALDSQNNIYVAGEFRGLIDLDPGDGRVSYLPSTSYDDFFIAKYNPSGIYLWSNKFTSVGGQISAGGVTVDSFNNVIFTGSFWGTVDFDPTTGSDTKTSISNVAFISKLTSNGGFLWNITNRFISYGFNGSRAVATDANDNILDLGEMGGTIDFDPDVGVTQVESYYARPYIAKYNSSGQLLWANNISGSSYAGNNQRLEAYSFAIDSGGNVNIAGFFLGDLNLPGETYHSTSNLFDLFVAKFSGAGNFVSAFVYPTGIKQHDYAIMPNSVMTTIDQSNNLYIAGAYAKSFDVDPGVNVVTKSMATSHTVTNNTEPQDVFVVKLDSSGGYLNSYSLGSSATNYPLSLVYSPLNRLVLFCKLNSYTGGLIQYDSAFPADNIPPTPPEVLSPLSNHYYSSIEAQFFGHAEPYSLVNLNLLEPDLDRIWTTLSTTSNSLGDWTVRPDVLGRGRAQIEVMDYAGNLTSSDNIITFTIGASAPIATIDNPLNSSIDMNSTPTIRGTVSFCNAVTLYLNGSPVSLSTLDFSYGEWSYIPESPLADGTYNITLELQYNNDSIKQVRGVFTVDTVAPAAPVIVSPANNQHSADPNPTLSGTAEPNSTVDLSYLDAEEQAQWLLRTTTDSQGIWSLRIPFPLEEGSYRLFAIASDSAGNTSPNSELLTLTIDLQVPGAPTIEHPANLSYTNDLTPTISGLAEPYATVHIYGNGSLVGDATATSTGNWNFVPSSNLSVGTQLLNALSEDSAGNKSNISTTSIFFIDNIPPIAPIITSPANGSASLTSTILFRGTAEGMSTVNLYLDGELINNTIALSNGQWSLSIVIPSNNQTHSFYAKATDRAGNLGPKSDTLSIRAASTGENEDVDGDGLDAQQESQYGTNPNKADTDGDGISDGKEVEDGTNPLDTGSAYPSQLTSVCSDWNGFFGGMLNVMEHVNVGTKRSQITSVVYDAQGEEKYSNQFGLKPGGQYDSLINVLPGFAKNQTGRVCSIAPTGKLDGRMVYYKQAEDGNFQFALSMPFSGGSKGKQYLQWSTKQPSQAEADISNTVTNWIQISNQGQRTENGTLNFYTSSGALFQSKQIKIPANGRVDINGDIRAQATGLAEWIPKNMGTPFLVQNNRYYYDNSKWIESFDGAVTDTGRLGVGETIIVPFDTRSTDSRLQVSNTIMNWVGVQISFYDSYGKLKRQLSGKLKSKATWNIDIASNVPKQSGVVMIKGDLPLSLIASLTQAQLTSTKSIQNLISLQALEPLGSSLSGSYNTYLDQSCKLLLANKLAQEVHITMTMTRSDLTPVFQDQIVKVPSRGLKEINVCTNEQPDHYGTVRLVLDKPNSILGNLVRVGSGNGYRMPTKLRQ